MSVRVPNDKVCQVYLSNSAYVHLGRGVRLFGEPPAFERSQTGQAQPCQWVCLAAACDNKRCLARRGTKLLILATVGRVEMHLDAPLDLALLARDQQ
jgi:hypothetical protein